MDELSVKRAEELAHGLFPHQVEGIAFLLGRRRALLADDMGLGKRVNLSLPWLKRNQKVPTL